MQLTPLQITQLNARVALANWQRIVPKRAVAVRNNDGPNHFAYLHPTKGWKRVSNKRVTG